MENLPVEIIQTIFLQLYSQHTIFPLHLRLGKPRLVVTHVCSRWRAIALSTPTLWTNFYILVQNSYPAPQPGPIRTWISRSAQSPLSIELLSSAEYVETSFLIVDLVFPVVHRCSLLNLHLSTATLNQLLTLPPNSLHALKSIKLLIKDNAFVADPPLFATAFQSCPELRAFSLTTYVCPGHLIITKFNIPWHQLTTLCLHSFLTPAHECLDTVRRCTSLQECDILISPVDDLALQRIIDLSRHPVVLPSLHTLQVEFPDSENVNFLHAVRLPCLRKFIPELPEWTPAHPAFWSLSILQSVLCDTIRELDLSQFPIPDSLSETLAGVPNLEILSLNGEVHKYPGIMRALGEGIIAPHLTTLELGDVPSWDLLFDMLETRVTAAHANHDITTFVTFVDECDDPMDEARRLALTETGMQIKFWS